MTIRGHPHVNQRKHRAHDCEARGGWGPTGKRRSLAPVRAYIHPHANPHICLHQLAFAPICLILTASSEALPRQPADAQWNSPRTYWDSIVPQ